MTTEDWVDELAPEPLHHQLQRIFVRKIDSGAWPPGHRLDAEVALSERYGVSRATMRQAILALVSKGLVTRKQGLGTFVAHRKQDFAIPLAHPSPTHARHELVSIDVRTRDAEAAEMLGLPESTLLTRIDRVRYERDDPIALEQTFQPSSSCPGIEGMDLSTTLAEVLEKYYGITVARRRSTVEPVLLDGPQQEQLQMNADPALGLLLTLTAYSAQDEPLILAHMTFRGDRCRALFTT